MGGTYPTLWSLKNLTWYLWDAANIQLLGPLLLLFILGTAAAIRRCVRDRSPENLYPELLGGAFVSWVGMTWLTHKDPRYDLPALVYMAVLSTAWIAELRGRLRRWVTAVLGLAVAASFAGVAFGLGGTSTLRVALPGAFPASYEQSPLGERYVTLYSTRGWLRGAPENNDGNVPALLSGLRRDGVTAVTFCCANPIDFNVIGLSVMTTEAGLDNPVNPAVLRPQDVFLAAHAPVLPGDPPPCQRLSDGIGIYAVLGDPFGKAFSQYTFICPGRRPGNLRVPSDRAPTARPAGQRRSVRSCSSGAKPARPSSESARRAPGGRRAAREPSTAPVRRAVW